MNNFVPEVSIGNIRWIIFPRNGKPVVENHQFDRTWKKVYKDNFNAIDAVCFQLIPEGIKYFADPSPFGEYWVFEEFICQIGGATKHITRNLCSKQKDNYWKVISINNFKRIQESYMTDEEIGYQSLHFLNKN